MKRFKTICIYDCIFANGDMFNVFVLQLAHVRERDAYIEIMSNILTATLCTRLQFSYRRICHTRVKDGISCLIESRYLLVKCKSLCCVNVCKYGDFSPAVMLMSVSNYNLYTYATYIDAMLTELKVGEQIMFNKLFLSSLYFLDVIHAM